MTTLNPPSHLKLRIVSHTNTKKIMFDLSGEYHPELRLEVTLLPPPILHDAGKSAPACGSLMKLELGKFISIDQIPQIIEALKEVKRLADEFPTWIKP